MDFLNKYQRLIAENIEKYQFNGEPFELYEPMNYIIANGGKRLRPVLTLMAAELFGGDMDKALKPALAIEFFHNFTLIHDDIMDEAPLRRNKPTVHTLHGINIGILSGDALLIKSYQFFEDLEDSLFKKCIQLFSETGIKICEGQQMDVNFETNNKVSYDNYIQMITYKTAVLCASALKIGAIIAHAEESDAHAIYEFGRHLGIAFQMMDDYLDVFGSQEQFGKRQAGDIYENKKTILYLLALENADEEQKKSLLHWYSLNTDEAEKAQAVEEIFRSTGADKKTLELIQKHNDLAQNYLNKIKLPEEKKHPLIALAAYLLERKV
jgi:possible geranyltranstransferase